jgi:hypothetical protein
MSEINEKKNTHTQKTRLNERDRISKVSKFQQIEKINIIMLVHFKVRKERTQLHINQSDYIRVFYEY